MKFVHEGRFMEKAKLEIGGEEPFAGFHQFFVRR